MGKPKVYYSKISPVEVFEKALNQQFDNKDFVAIKIHFGERGNQAYLKPQHVKPVVERLGRITPNYFLTDANTIYKGSRSNALDHIKTAQEHGYNFAPIIIADGLWGHDFIKVRIDMPHFKEAYVASAAVEADALLVLTHFKGHDVVGFGGAIKNLGMGFGCRSGKQQMHADIKPQVNADVCTACGNCIKWCPKDTINAQADGKAFIDLANCIGCGECVAACRFGAISISWEGKPDIIQEKIAEYAYAAIKGKENKTIFINYLLEISPNCDCYSENDPPIVPDIGFLASDDAVAIDQASLDLVNQAAQQDIFKKIYPYTDGTVQLEYAEKIGLGSRDYELIGK